MSGDQNEIEDWELHRGSEEWASRIAGLPAPTPAQIERFREIARKGAEAYRNSVVVPFDFGRSVESVPLMAAAAGQAQERFTVMWAQSWCPGTSIDDADFLEEGSADLQHGPVETEAGDVFATLLWRPSATHVGFEGVQMALIERSSRSGVAVGTVRRDGEDLIIEINRGSFDPGGRMDGSTHFLVAFT